MKYVLILCAFLGACVGILYFMLDNAQNKIIMLESEKKAILQKLENKENEIKKFNASQTAAGKQIAKIKTKIVKIPTSCYNTVIDSAIINGVRGE